VVHNTALNGSDNLPCYPPDKNGTQAVKPHNKYTAGKVKLTHDDRSL